MPDQYDLLVSPAGMCRDGAFTILREAARIRGLAQSRSISRSFAISQVRAHLANAWLRDRTARQAGFVLP